MCLEDLSQDLPKDLSKARSAKQPRRQLRRAVLAAEEGTVEGAATCERCLWWPFLLTELVLLLAYSYAATRAIAIRPRIIISLAVPVLTYIFFILWNPDCLETPWLFWIIRSGSFFCKYFLLIDVGLFGLATLLWQKSVRRTGTEPNPNR